MLFRKARPRIYTMIDRYSGVAKETERPKRKPRERRAFLEDDSNDFGEIPSTRRNLWEGFPKLTKASASPQSQAHASRGGLNTVFRFWQLSSNSAKPPRPAPLWLRTQSGGW